MKKIALSLFLAIALLAVASPVLADTDVSSSENVLIQLRYEDISSISPKLSVSGTTATYQLTAICNSSSASIIVTYQLQKQGSDGTYSNYGSSWTASSSTYYIIDSGTRTVASGGTYRLMATVTPYISGVKGTAETVYS